MLSGRGWGRVGSMQDVFNPQFWNGRIDKAPPGEDHRAVFECTLSRWKEIEASHRKILDVVVEDSWSVLDVGCGWGRLLDLMPGSWVGDYLGIDITPRFIEQAQLERTIPKRIGGPIRQFILGDVRETDVEVVTHRLVEGWPSYPSYPASMTSPTTVGSPSKVFDLAVLVSIRPMFRRTIGGDGWDEVERKVRRVAGRILYLEYNPSDLGEVVIVHPTSRLVESREPAIVVHNSPGGER